MIHCHKCNYDHFNWQSCPTITSQSKLCYGWHLIKDCPQSIHKYSNQPNKIEAHNYELKGNDQIECLKTCTNNAAEKLTNKTKSNECCICFDDINSRIALIPCGHTNICKDCSKILQKSECPICKQKITSIQNIYID